MTPNTIQVQAALETLRQAGWRLVPPVANRLQLLSVRETAAILGVHDDTAGGISKELPGTVMLPGGDLRVRLTDLEDFLRSHPAVPKV